MHGIAILLVEILLLRKAVVCRIDFDIHEILLRGIIIHGRSVVIISSLQTQEVIWVERVKATLSLPGIDLLAHIHVLHLHMPHHI